MMNANTAKKTGEIRMISDPTNTIDVKDVKPYMRQFVDCKKVNNGNFVAMGGISG